MCVDVCIFMKISPAAHCKGVGRCRFRHGINPSMCPRWIATSFAPCTGISCNSIALAWGISVAVLSWRWQTRVYRRFSLYVWYQPSDYFVSCTFDDTTKETDGTGHRKQDHDNLCSTLCCLSLCHLCNHKTTPNSQTLLSFQLLVILCCCLHYIMLCFRAPRHSRGLLAKRMTN